MPASRFYVHDDGARLFKGQQMLGYAGLSGAHGSNDISTRSGSVSRKIPKDLVPRPIAKSRHGSLNVGRPCVVVRLSDPWHGTIVAELTQKSKNSTLDDTLIIFDNIFHSLFMSG